MWGYLLHLMKFLTVWKYDQKAAFLPVDCHKRGGSVDLDGIDEHRSGRVDHSDLPAELFADINLIGLPVDRNRDSPHSDEDFIRQDQPVGIDDGEVRRFAADHEKPAAAAVESPPEGRRLNGDG